MDNEKLDRLRRKYQDAPEMHIFDEEMKSVASRLLVDGARALPFAGMPTLLDAPYQEGFDDLDIALLGVPFDLGVSNRPGARFGPRALRTIERIGPYNHQTKVLPFGSHKIADVGDVPKLGRYDLSGGMGQIEAWFHRIKDAGVRPLTAGGDHSITYPILKALGRDEPVGLIHIDAHCDTMGEFEGSKFNHGGPFRFAVLDGVLDPERTVQIGIRGSSEFLWEFSYEAGMTVFHIEDVASLGIDAIVKKARDVVGDGPTYVSFDVDGLDPAFAPGTGTPEVGGLTPREAQALLRGFMGLNIIGGDVVEIAPQYDPTSNTAQIGAQMLFEILCLMSASESS